MRVNARLDEARERKLRAIAKETGQGVSEVVRVAIDVYYERITTSATRSLALLERSGFVGCADGPPDLSETYKEELAFENLLSP